MSGMISKDNRLDNFDAFMGLTFEVINNFLTEYVTSQTKNKSHDDVSLNFTSQ